MYTMNYKARTLFTPLVDEYALEKPMLNQEANRLSSISFTIYPVHPEYGRIEPLKGELALYLDGNRIGRYRPVGYKKAMRGGIAWQFEEMAAALNDIKRRPTSFHGSPEVLCLRLETLEALTRKNLTLSMRNMSAYGIF